uniref:Uncharacterized protein n=1 Tax=Arundo donax TaxID=35708 RepID=A0A0A9BD22_ARUDO
MRLLFAET